MSLNLPIWNAAVYCTQVAPDTPYGFSACTFV